MRFFWIISGNAIARSYIFYCPTCRKLDNKLGEQNMTDLHEEKSADVAPLAMLTWICLGLLSHEKVK